MTRLFFGMTLPVLCLNQPSQIFQLRIALPVGVLPIVVMVSEALPGGVSEFGLNEAVAPAGRPALTAKFTRLLNPFSAATLTVEVALPPGLTEADPGVADSVKLGVDEPNGTIWMPLSGARS